ncbi:MAG: S8 family serine peptidase, partial [Clostridium sp.]
TSLLEQYISTLATLERATICIAAGNEGSAAHHVGGVLKDEKNISIKVISPSGASSGFIEVSQGFKGGSVGSDRYEIINTGPKPFDIIGEVTLSLTSNRQYLTTGQWEVIMRVNNNYTGIFDIWLPILEGLNSKTKFLQPTVSNTLGIPATVTNIIAVGSYNYINNNISSFSGRGRDDVIQLIRPDIVAPGEDITSVAPNRTFDTKSGTSMATPHVTGIAALLMEWGIAKNNDPFLYGERLKYYLVRGAKRNRSDVIYPNSSWGYGEVCAYKSFEIVVDVINSLKR